MPCVIAAQGFLPPRNGQNGVNEMTYPATAIAQDAVWPASATKYSETTYALQVELRKKGHYSTAYLLDGKFGPATIKAWQRYMRDYGRYEGKYTGAIDGVVGSMTVSAAYSFLAPDGGNAWGVIYNYDLNPTSIFPNYQTSLAWQKFLNYRRNKA